jgi:ribonuclease HII
MTILIGVDEAGYGPNLGPLCIAATAWQLNDDASQAEPTQRAGATGPPAPDLYEILAAAVVRSPAKCPRRIAIADSKQLYKPGGGLRLLERGVLAACELLGIEPPPCGAASLPWHAEPGEATPIDLAAEDVAAAAGLLSASCGAAGVELAALRASVIHPCEFNDLCDRFGTKGAALSHATLALVRSVVDEARDGCVACDKNQQRCDAAHGSAPHARLRQPRPSLVAASAAQDACCHGPSSPAMDHHSAPSAFPLPPSPLLHITLDKHGGRNRYAAILSDQFPDSWVDVVREGRAESVYRFAHRGATVEARFRVGGEAELPTALASMTAKYLRELAMRRFNRWWQARVPGLRRTAGYPVDARRFRAEIAEEQRRLGIADRDLWRAR